MNSAPGFKEQGHLQSPLPSQCFGTAVTCFWKQHIWPKTSPLKFNTKWLQTYSYEMTTYEMRVVFSLDPHMSMCIFSKTHTKGWKTLQVQNTPQWVEKGKCSA
ncbi:UNVERIFIED_CONTAM: hypothetical protein K2H54_038459 [Gekko kuhli]